MKINFTDLPVFVPVEEYHAAIQRMVDRLKSNNDILSIYQVGGINTPGISDIDLYLILRNGAILESNPVQDITVKDRYLFCHNLFGTCEEIAVQMEKFTFFGNFRFLHGKETDLHNYTLRDDDRMLLQKQIALEYLVKAWISISIQLYFGIIKTRGLLLHSKAILYDLKFLNIENSSLKDTIEKLMIIRNNWFKNTPDFTGLEQLTRDYQDQLLQTISNEINHYGFYMDPNVTYRIAKRLTISNSPNPQFSSSGLSIPSFLTARIKLFRKLQNRFHDFHFGIPVSTLPVPEIIQQRRNMLKNAQEYNKKHLPHLICGGFPLQIFS